MSSLLSLPLAGGTPAGLLCRMAGRRTPDGAAPGPMPGCDTTIFLSCDNSFWRYGTCAQASTPERFHRRLRCRHFMQCARARRAASVVPQRRLSCPRWAATAPMPKSSAHRTRRPRCTSQRCVPCRGFWPLAASGVQMAARKRDLWKGAKTLALCPERAKLRQ